MDFLDDEGEHIEQFCTNGDDIAAVSHLLQYKHQKLYDKRCFYCCWIIHRGHLRLHHRACTNETDQQQSYMLRQTEKCRYCFCKNTPLFKKRNSAKQQAIKYVHLLNFKFACIFIVWSQKRNYTEKKGTYMSKSNHSIKPACTYMHAIYAFLNTESSFFMSF